MGPPGRFLPGGSSLGSVRGQSFCRKGNWNKKNRKGGNFKMHFKNKFLISSLVLLLVVIGGYFMFSSFKLKNLENDVVEYLIKEQDIKKENIDAKGYKANLPGDRRNLVSIKIKGDKKVYSYFKDQETGKIKMESYIDGDREVIVNN